jgi:hypothetical protein
VLILILWVEIFGWVRGFLVVNPDGAWGKYPQTPVEGTECLPTPMFWLWAKSVMVVVPWVISVSRTLSFRP